MKRTNLALSAVAISTILGTSQGLNAAEGLSIFEDVKFKGQIRPRYEMADVSGNNLDTANSLTNRLHLSATAGLFDVEGLSATVGLQSINNFGYTDYSIPSTNPKKYDVINDPQEAMLSEASLDYKTGNTSFHAGRSQLNLDNQRFIGTVGWRQLERSYDTLSFTNTDIKNLEVMGAYLYGYAGVGSVETTETSSVLLHAKYKAADALTITAYDYMIGSLSDTLGIALSGGAPLGGAKVSYLAEFAMQSDPTMEYRIEDVKADAGYMNLDLGANISGILVGANFENLEKGFNPALGTNHKFNGWADVFYVGNAGPSGGLQDFNLRLGYVDAKYGKVLGFYHNFSAQSAMASGSSTTKDLGSEFDLLYTNKIPFVQGLNGLLKYASYTSGDTTNFANANFDKQVFWAELDYKF